MIWFLIALISCIWVFYEDFKYRSVHVLGFFLILFSLLILKMINIGVIYVLIHISHNLLFLVILLGMLTLYICFKQKRKINIFEEHFGLGDLLLLVGICPFFNLENYILFIISSLIVSIMLTPLILKIQGKEKNIPLAGIQAVCMIPLLIIERLYPIDFSIYSYISSIN